MDTDLFMECEEEELEPWQQVDDRVEEDEMDFMDGYGETADLSPLSDSETPPPRTPPPITAPPITAPPITAPTASPLVHVVRPPLPLPPPPPSSSSSSPAVAPPLMSQAAPLILTQTSGGTFLLPAAPGTHHGSPILFSTQGFPMMNRGAPLVLNLRPGQTVQPLTLIQSPSLGQLVRPSVGVSPILTQSRPGAAQTGAFTAMLSIRTSTPQPVNFQMTQVGGASPLKLAGSPALPSGSANGVTRITLEEELISMIEERPPLYNASEKNYFNQVVKRDCWRQITEKMHISEKETKKKWESLRTQFIRYRRLPPSGSCGTDQTPRQQWILSRLHFLEPHTKRKESESDPTHTDPPAPTDTRSGAAVDQDETALESVLLDPGFESASASAGRTRRPPATRSRKPHNDPLADPSMGLMCRIETALYRLSADGRPDSIALACQSIQHKFRMVPPHLLHRLENRVQNLIFNFFEEHNLHTHTNDS
ncbi:uncharacterized protein LOC144514238 isoform X1 [Sander vitreus]